MRWPPLCPYSVGVRTLEFDMWYIICASLGVQYEYAISENRGVDASDIFEVSHGVKRVDSCRILGLPHSIMGQGSSSPSPCPFPHARRKSSFLKRHRLYIRSTWLKQFGSRGILLRFYCEVPQCCYGHAYGCIFGFGPDTGGKVLF